MPKIYVDASRVPELNGEVRGGVTVVLHRPDEIDGLLAISEWAPRPPESPLQSVYKALVEPTLNFQEWQTHWRSIRKSPSVNDTLYKKEKFDPHDLLSSDLSAFKETLQIAQDLWRGQPGDEIDDLCCVIMLAEHTSATPRKLEITGDKAVFVLHRASIVADIVKLPLYPMVFCVGLVAGGGATPSARVNSLVERLRSSAKSPQEGLALRDIRTVSRADLGTRRLIVLVHGLLSTDVGTFDELEVLLQGHANHVLVAGYPHDSIMTSIDENGRELAQIISDLKLPKGSVRFACHSRGGLVARSAATWLAREQSNSVLGGCSTFGTPHSGSPLAEAPGAFIAAGVMLALTRKTRSTASLLDALSCYAYSNDFPGVAGLRPPRRDDTYLSKLQKEEGLYADRFMPMFVVGGRRQPQQLNEWIASRPLHGLDHDLVVPTASALPRLQSNQPSFTVDCDHYSYFSSYQATTLAKAAEFLTKGAAAANR